MSPSDDQGTTDGASTTTPAEQRDGSAGAVEDAEGPATPPPSTAGGAAPPDAEPSPPAVSESDAGSPMPDPPDRDPDAGPLRDAAVVASDAGVATCDGMYLVPCYDGVPDRGDIGELSVSDVPRPACPEALPVVGAECSGSGLTCGYGSRARADCRRIFECSDGVWHDESPPCYATPPGHCPDAAPETGDDCDVIIIGGSDLAVCEYGDTVTCTCGPRHFRDGVLGWVCNAPPSTDGCPAVAPNYGEGCDVQGTECAYGPLCQPAGGRWFCRDGEWEYAGQHEACYRD